MNVTSINIYNRLISNTVYPFAIGIHSASLLTTAPPKVSSKIRPSQSLLVVTPNGQQRCAGNYAGRPGTDAWNGWRMAGKHGE